MPRMRIPLPIIIIFLAIALFRVAANVPNLPTALPGEDYRALIDPEDGDFDAEMNGNPVPFASGPVGLVMPKDFPPDMPVYPGAILVRDTTEASSQRYSFTTSVGIDLVGAYYAKQLTEDGWALTNRQFDPLQANFQGQKDERTLTVAVASDGAQTLINLNVTKTKP